MTAPNPSCGEAEFRGVKLRIDFHRFRALERRTGKKMQRLIAEWSLGLGLDDLVEWVRCFAVTDLTEDQVISLIHQGSLVEDYGAISDVIAEMMEAFTAPPPKEGDDPPPKAE